MTNPITMYLLLSIFIPIIAVAVIFLCRHRPNLRESISILSAAAVFYCCLVLYQSYSAEDHIALSWLELVPGLTISFNVEPLGLIFALMSSFLWLITSIYSIGYMRAHHEKNQTRFYQFFALTMASVMGLAFSANLFTLYIFYELLTLSTYPLVTHHGHKKAKFGGRNYLVFLFFTSVLFFLPALIYAWVSCDNTDFLTMGLLQHPSCSGTSLNLLLPLFILGIGKAALFPFHRWLPAAMVAPTPVSALLHAVAVVKGGVFTVIKICVYVFGLDTVATLPSQSLLIYLAAFTVLFASFKAIFQDNLKRRLAYSTVSQLGYITIGALLANTAGLVGSAMHLVIHGFGKITLFFCAGAILISTNFTKISQMQGIGKQMPITMGAFMLASVSIIGLPPTGGAWSKWFLLQGIASTEHWPILVILATSSILSVFYLLPVGIKAFTGLNQKTITSRHEAPTPMLIAITTCAIACVLLFLFPQPLYELALQILSSNQVVVQTSTAGGTL